MNNYTNNMMYRNNMNNKMTNDNFCVCKKITEEESTCIDALPLAMAYVPIQKFEHVFECEEALAHGTIFEKLYLPFTKYQGGYAR